MGHEHVSIHSKDCFLIYLATFAFIMNFKDLRRDSNFIGLTPDWDTYPCHKLPNPLVKVDEFGQAEDAISVGISFYEVKLD